MKDAKPAPDPAEETAPEPGRMDTAEFPIIKPEQEPEQQEPEQEEAPAEPEEETPEPEPEEPAAEAPADPSVTRTDIPLPEKPAESKDRGTMPALDPNGTWTVEWRTTPPPKPEPEPEPEPTPPAAETPAQPVQPEEATLEPPQAREPAQVEQPPPPAPPAQVEEAPQPAPSAPPAPPAQVEEAPPPAPPARPAPAQAEWTAPFPPQPQPQAPPPYQAPPPVQPHPQAAYQPQPPAPYAPEAPPSGVEQPVEKKGRKRGVLIAVVAALILLAGVATGQLVRPVPEPTLGLTLPASSHTFQGNAPALPWPTAGQSVVAVDGLGVMGSSGGAAPIPTASVAKVMTAYVFLRDHPLRSGEPGPTFDVSPQGVAELPQRIQRGESLLRIKAGQRLTERKALEALMIISANDVAHELARWDTGNAAAGDTAFVAKMNAAARSLGMTGTTYTDPSGYDSRTVSTAADQVKLLTAAMKLPGFAEIVNRRAYVPDDGGPARPGGNILLGQQGVVGGKTGYTDKAGGNYVFAARRRVAGVPTLMIGAVMGQRSPTAVGAIDTAKTLVTAAGTALTSATLAQAGKTVGEVDDGLGDKTPLTAGAPLTVVGWPGLTVPVGVEGDPPRTAAAGERVGTVTAGAARVPLRAGGPLDEPSPVQKLLRLG